MPKVTYSATKGIVQSNGSGFIINDVSITEGSESITAGSAANTYGVNVLAGGATLADGDTAGQKATFIFAGADTLSQTAGNIVGGDITGSAGAVVVLLWNGAKWVQVSA